MCLSGCVYCLCVCACVCLIALKGDRVRFCSKKKYCCDCLVSRRKSFSVFGIMIWTHHIDWLMYCCTLYKHTLVSLWASLLWKRKRENIGVLPLKITAPVWICHLCLLINVCNIWKHKDMIWICLWGYPMPLYNSVCTNNCIEGVTLH